MTSIKISDVSAVVCSLNAENSIAMCLESLVENNIEEIILVDANSKDNTVKIASKYTNLIYSDPGKGLAIARNIGINKASKKYILNFGCDNILTQNCIEEMISDINKNYTAVSVMTKLKNPNKNYLSWSLNQYKIARYFPEERNVIGTPNLFPIEILKNNKYDNNMRWSDDADLCDRLRLKGHKFAISNSFVYEIGSEDIKSIINRWKEYGRGDSKIYMKYSNVWNWKRKIQSYMHPFYVDLILPLINKPNLKKITIIFIQVLILLLDLVQIVQ